MKFFKLFISFAGDVYASEFSRSQINRFLLDLSKDYEKWGKGNRSVNSAITILKALFNHGIKVHELDIKNPVVGIKPFAEERKLSIFPLMKKSRLSWKSVISRKLC